MKETMEKDLNTLRAEAATMKETMEKVQKEHEAKEKDLNEAMTMKETMEKDLNNVRAEAATMKETIEKVQKEHEAKDLEYRTAQFRSELLYTHNKNLTITKERLTKINQEANKQIEELKKQLEEIRKRCENEDNYDSDTTVEGDYDLDEPKIEKRRVKRAEAARKEDAKPEIQMKYLPHPPTAPRPTKGRAKAEAHGLQTKEKKERNAGLPPRPPTAAKRERRPMSWRKPPTGKISSSKLNDDISTKGDTGKAVSERIPTPTDVTKAQPKQPEQPNLQTKQEAQPKIAPGKPKAGKKLFRERPMSGQKSPTDENNKKPADSKVVSKRIPRPAEEPKMVPRPPSASKKSFRRPMSGKKTPTNENSSKLINDVNVKGDTDAIPRPSKKLLKSRGKLPAQPAEGPWLKRPASGKKSPTKDTNGKASSDSNVNADARESGTPGPQSGVAKKPVKSLQDIRLPRISEATKKSFRQQVKTGFGKLINVNVNPCDLLKAGEKLDVNSNKRNFYDKQKDFDKLPPIKPVNAAVDEVKTAPPEVTKTSSFKLPKLPQARPRS